MHSVVFLWFDVWVVAPVLACGTPSLLACKCCSDQLAKFRFENFCWFIDLQNEVVCVCLCLYTIVCAHVSVANQSNSTRIYSPVKQRGPSASTLRSSFGQRGRQFNEIPFPLLLDTTHFCSPAHINMCVCKWVCQKFVRMFFTKKHQLLPNAVCV